MFKDEHGCVSYLMFVWYKTISYLVWYKRISEGQEVVADEEHPGRPTTSRTDEDIQKTSEMVWNDHYLSIRMIAEIVNIAQKIFREVLHENLNMGKVCGKIVLQR